MQTAVGTRERYDSFAEEDYCTSHHLNQEIHDFLQPRGWILDVGSGYGARSYYLKEEGFDVIAVDISIIALKRRKLCRICADAQRLPFKANTFGSVLCLDVLEHLPKPQMCIQEVSRVLKDGGRSIFATPIFNIPLPKLIPLVRKLRSCDVPKSYHLRVFRDKELIYMIGLLLRIKTIRYAHHGFSLISILHPFGKRLDHFLSSHQGFIPISQLLASGVLIVAEKSIL